MSSSFQTQQPLARFAQRTQAVIDQVLRVFVGERECVELLLIGLLAQGHLLLEGVPGVAKTTLAKAFAQTLGCRFKRIQFTPDLLPADITGTYVLSPNEGSFKLRQGPIFANVILADEINRAPARTQSALLEAMQEYQATIEGETRPLPQPFVVIATQNPVEQAGTYPLPEAQIDRFLIRLVVGYPSAANERAMLRRFSAPQPEVQAILAPEEVMAMQRLVGSVHVQEELIDYVVRIAEFTRRHTQVLLGASPRASLALVRAARARALLEGRDYVLPDDIKRLVVPVLAHRLMLTAEAEMDGTQPDAVLRQTLDQVSYRR